jgi:hypothetical protein
MESRFLRLLREARGLFRRDAMGFGVGSSAVLVVALVALAYEPTNLLAWAAAVFLFPVGLRGLAIAVTAVFRAR